MEVSEEFHASAALIPRKSHPVPIGWRLDGPQSRCEGYGEDEHIVSVRNRIPAILHVARRYTV